MYIIYRVYILCISRIMFTPCILYILYAVYILCVVRILRIVYLLSVYSVSLYIVLCIYHVVYSPYNYLHYTYIYIYIHTHIHICIHTYTYTYIHIYIYAYIHIHIHIQEYYNIPNAKITFFTLPI